MKLIDTINGPVWGLWVTIGLLAIISIVMLSGHGAWLIAGYNTASTQKKAMYDEKRLCKVVGAETAFCTLLLLVMAIFMKVLPASFAWVFVVLVVVSVVAMMFICNKFCKK